MYSLKSLKINATKVASYDKLKAEFNETMGEKTRLEGQLYQAIQDRKRYKSERNLSRGEKAKLEQRITKLLLRITELEVEVASLTIQLEVEHRRAEDASRSTSTSRTLTLTSGEMRSSTLFGGSAQTLIFSSLEKVCLEWSRVSRPSSLRKRILSLRSLMMRSFR